MKSEQLKNKGVKPYSLRSISLGSKDLSPEPRNSGFQRIRLGQENASPVEMTPWMEEEAQALSITEEAKARAQLIEKEAYEKAYVQGERAGMEVAERRFRSALESLEAAHREFEGLKSELLWRSEGELMELSVAIARKIIQKEITLNEGFVIDLIRSSLKYVIDRDNVKVRVNPSDFGYLVQFKKDLSSDSGEIKGLVFEEDPGISRGGALIETSYGDIDCRIDKRIADLEKCFRGIFEKLDIRI